MYGTEFARVSGSYSTAYIGTYELLRQEGNSSVFKLRAYFYYGGGTQVNSSTSGGFYIDGTWVHGGSYSNVKPGYHLWGEKEITVNHNNDGSFPGRYVEISGQSYHIKGSAGGYLSAPKINRQANILTAQDFNDEANPTITYENPAGNNVTSLKACIASVDGQKIYVPYRDISKTGTSYTFNLTDTERKNLRQALTANSMYVAFYVTTVIDGQTFYSPLQRLLTLINANPEFSNFTFKDVNSVTVALTGNNQNIIKGASNVEVTIPVASKATAKKEAVMNKYRFTCGDKSADIQYKDSEDVKGTIQNIPNGTFTVYATDNRGNSSPVTKLSNQVIDYTPLVKGNIDVYRNNGVSEEVVLQFDGLINEANFGAKSNSIIYAYYQYSVAGSGVWSDNIEITPEVKDGKFSYNAIISGDLENKGFDISNSYEIMVSVFDELSGLQYTDTFGSGIPNLAYHKNGISVMGKYDVEEGGPFQVQGKNPFKKDIITAWPTSEHYFNVPYKEIPLDASIAIGTKLTLENGRIRIGKGVTRIKVAGSIFIEQANTGSYIWSFISRIRNGSRVDIKGHIMSTSLYFVSAVIPNGVIDVQEGDEILLIIDNPKYESVQPHSRAYQSQTWLTVEVIE